LGLAFEFGNGYRTTHGSSCLNDCSVHSLSHLLQLRLGLYCLDANISKSVSYFSVAARTVYQMIPINRRSATYLVFNLSPFSFPMHVVCIRKSRRARFGLNDTRLI